MGGSHFVTDSENLTIILTNYEKDKRTEVSIDVSDIVHGEEFEDGDEINLQLLGAEVR